MYGDGGGVEGYGTFSGCTIQSNYASESGGGVYLGPRQETTFSDCVIYHNSAGHNGGGAAQHYSQDLGGPVPVLTRCFILANLAVYDSGGVECYVLNLERCTIAGNLTILGVGAMTCIDSAAQIPVTMTNSIVWGNSGGSLVVRGVDPVVTYSCVEGADVLPGEGNINADPLFCRRAAQPEVYVDPSRPEPGDGSAENPFNHLGRALEVSAEIAENSPCRGTGLGGANMGAGEVGCATAPAGPLVVYLAPGTYTANLFLTTGVSLVGSDPETTVIEGTVWGLRTGSGLSNVTVRGGLFWGIIIGSGESPLVEGCLIAENGTDPGITQSLDPAGGGVFCGDSGAQLVGCRITRNRGHGAYCGFNGCTARIEDCDIAANWSTGLHVEGDATVDSCRIAGNGSRGMICVRSGSGTQIRNTVIMGNRLHGISSLPLVAMSISLTNCLIAGNGSQGIRADGGGVVDLRNCVIGEHPVGSVSTGGRNVQATLRNCIFSGYVGVAAGIDDDEIGYCCFLGDTNISDCDACISADPRFVRPGVFDFDRPPATVVVAGQEFEVPDFIIDPGDYHLLPDSPCIDAGTCEGAPLFDLDGFRRPWGGGCDIGAYEFTAGPFFLRGDANDDTNIDIGDAIKILSWLFAHGAEPGCLASGDINIDGRIDIADPIRLIWHLFGGGPPPAAPYPACGPMQAGGDAALGCATVQQACR
ncbi:MAG TPA: hypothetical protein DCM87_14695 [Planctomycetes bacterium]|nr:hypothetical protein [Planctomycetota bacterium]